MLDGDGWGWMPVDCARALEDHAEPWANMERCLDLPTYVLSEDMIFSLSSDSVLLCYSFSCTLAPELTTKTQQSTSLSAYFSPYPQYRTVVI